MQIFGIDLTRKKPQKQNRLSVVPPSYDDGSTIITNTGYGNAAGYYGLVMDLDSIVKNENDLIRRYREVAQYSDTDSAITEIVNEAIISDDHKTIELNLDELKVSDSIKTKIQDEFQEVLKLFDFEEAGYDIFRQWYIDGRVYYQVLIDDTNTKLGISELRRIDPRKIRRIKNITKQRNEKGVEVVTNVEEYFVYNDKGINEQTSQGVKLSLDSIIYCPSGIIDTNSGMTLSHLHKAIKPTNQLKMMEDASVIYRMSRAPERRIFYIDVGNLPKLKAEQYVNDIMNKFRNKIVYDAVSGEIRNDRKHMCLDMNTRVPLLDGRTLTLSEIELEYKEKNLWAYSCDPVTGKFVPGLITWAGVSRPNAQVLRITLDNGETIVCTPDHRFPVWNKGLVPAEKLVTGDSMIPLYKRMGKITSSDKRGYEQIFDNVTKQWVFTHREVSRWKDETGVANEFRFSEKFFGEECKTVHHKNINRYDNSPENLVRMNSADHIVYHRSSGSSAGKVGGLRCFELQRGIFDKTHPDYFERHRRAGRIGGKVSSLTGKNAINYEKGRQIFAELMKDPEWSAALSEKHKLSWTEELRNNARKRAITTNLSKRGNDAQKEMWQTQERRAAHSTKYKTEYTEEIKRTLEDCLKTPSNLTVRQIADFLTNTVSLPDWKLLNSTKVGTQKSFLTINQSDVKRIINLLGFDNITHARESIQYRNHKIVSVEWLDETIDTGCLTIDGNELYHNHHTFAVEAGIYTQNSMMEDFWMPRREGGKGTEITTLPGGQTLGQIDDINYFQNKLFQALNVPLGRLQPQQGFSLGRSSEITRDEIKFNKFIGRLRKKFSNLLADALRIQIVLKGIIREDEWDDVKQKLQFDYQRDNFFNELKTNEMLLQRVTTLQQIAPFVGTYYSIEWVQKNLLMQSDDDIKTIAKQNKENPVPSMDGTDAPQNQSSQTSTDQNTN